MIAPIFSSLGIRNYRIYLLGQAVSLCGTWMQRTAQAWLVLELTGSGTAVGTVTAFQFVPILLLAPIGGLFADRFDKRRILYATQSLAAFSAVGLGLVVLTDVVTLWMVYVSALALGIAASFDAPARQTFVQEMVGRDRLTNAVSLNSTLVNAARIVGPALAGVLIVTIGIAWCFVFNGVSYLSLIAALLLMDAAKLHRSDAQQRSRRQLAAGFSYAVRTPAVRTPLILMAVAGLFTYEYQVVLPLFARFTFDGGPQTFAAMSSAMGVGAVAGGLLAASRANRPPVSLARTAIVFGVLQLGVSQAPALWVALGSLAVVGAASVTFIALGNATLQLTAEPAMRGRVMGIYVVAFFGTTPLGAPLMGWVGEHLGPRYALALGGVTLLGAAAYALPRLGRLPLVGETIADAAEVGPPPAKI